MFDSLNPSCKNGWEILKGLLFYSVSWCTLGREATLRVGPKEGSGNTSQSMSVLPAPDFTHEGLLLCFRKRELGPSDKKECLLSTDPLFESFETVRRLASESGRKPL